MSNTDTVNRTDQNCRYINKYNFRNIQFVLYVLIVTRAAPKPDIICRIILFL